MRLLAAAFALSCSLARATAPLQAGTTASLAVPATMTKDSRELLQAGRLTDALARADAAVAAGGGADALAARAEAKLALGRPLADAAADYGAAARLDPRYGERYRGLLAQMTSMKHPSRKPLTGAGGVSMKFVGALAALGLLLIAISIFFLRRKKSAGKSASEL